MLSEQKISYCQNNSNIKPKIVETEAKSKPVRHMTAHFLGWIEGGYPNRKKGNKI